MEELHRAYPPVPFGWVLWLQERLAARRARRRATRPWGEPAQGLPPGDLHHLAGPR